MASKAKIEKFDKINKARVKGRIGHSRTGACTARGKCYCKKPIRLGKLGVIGGKNLKKKSKVQA